MGQSEEELLRLMEEYGREPVCLAFSGGVDSSLLLSLAVEAARRQNTTVYAVTFHTRLHPACDLENAKRVAGELGAVHEILAVDELALSEIRNNPPDRCYLCKRHLFRTLKEYAEARGVSCILDGTNEDDLHEYRPGLLALKELGVHSPLAQCHMTKEKVRRMAKERGLSVSTRPSTPCMATRLPYGTLLEEETLRRIEAGEAYLKTVFSGNLRLRLHGETARIELEEAELPLALKERERLCRRLKELGFSYIALDLEGFCSGSMDRAFREKS